jgi:hypothetical protein
VACVLGLCSSIHRVEGRFGGRHREDEPAVASVNGAKSQFVSKECTVGFGIFAVQQNVCAYYHAGILAIFAGLNKHLRCPALEPMNFQL